MILVKETRPVKRVPPALQWKTLPNYFGIQMNKSPNQQNDRDPTKYSVNRGGHAN